MCFFLDYIFVIVGINVMLLIGRKITRSGFHKLVTFNTVKMVTNLPLYGTRGSLALDITIASYIINPFSFFFSLIHSTCILAGKETAGSPYPSPSSGYHLKMQALYGLP